MLIPIEIPKTKTIGKDSINISPREDKNKPNFIFGVLAITFKRNENIRVM
jgi:hypothetical protein